MSTQSLRIQYRPDPNTLPGKTWTVIEQIPFEPEIPSLADAAALLDAAFDYNPCTGETEPSIDELGQLDPTLTETEFFQLAGEIAPSGVCLYEEGFTAHIKVYLSDNDITFDFNVDGQGSVTQVSEHQSSVTYTLELEDSTSAPLEYPIYYSPSTNPAYDPLVVTDEAGNEIAVTASTDTLIFPSAMSGTFTVTHAVYIYLHYVHVPCSPLDDPLPTPRIIVFYDRLAYDETVVAPQIDTTNVPEDAQYIDCRGGNSYGGSYTRFAGVSDMCTKRVYHWSECTCSGDRVNTSYQDEHVLCDDWGTVPYERFDGYVDCAADAEELHTPEFYLETCCVPYDSSIRGELPLCEESTTIFYGGVPFEDQERWENDHGVGNVIFIPISPRGEPCGEHIIEQDLGSLDCCGPGLESLVWTQTQSSIEWGESAVFCVDGGSPPYTWESSLPGIVINGTGPCRRLDANDCFCAPILITVTDSCNSRITTEVNSTEGQWVDRVSDDCNYPGDADNDLPDSNSAVYLERIESDSVKQTQRWARSAYSEGGSIAPFDTPQEYLDNYVAEYMATLSSPLCITPVNYTREHPSLNFYYRNENYVYQGFGDNWTITAHIWYPGSDKNTYDWECPGQEDQLVYDDDASPDVILDNNISYFYWDGGEPPFRLRIEGVNVWLDYGKTTTQATTTGRFYYIHSGNVCGVVDISITDNCGNTVHGQQRATSGVWTTVGQYSQWLNDKPCGLYYDGCPPGNTFDITVGDTRVQQTLSGVPFTPQASSTLSASQASCASRLNSHLVALQTLVEDLGQGFYKPCVSCSRAHEVTPCAYVVGAYDFVDPCQTAGTCWAGVYSAINYIGGWYYDKSTRAYTNYYQEWRFIC